MNFKLTIAAAALFASLTATAALASTGFLNAGSAFQSGVAPAPPCKVIYLSDQTTARDYLYLNFSPWTSYTPLPALPAVDNGWGLWATFDLIYAGEAPNKINVYKPCGKERGFSLTTAGFDPPTSIAVDTNDNTYATEYTSDVIDWFAGSTDHATTTDNPYRTPGLPYYLAVDNAGNVYVNGWNSTNTAAQIDKCTPHMVTCAVCETVTPSSWPGGIALDKFQNLIVNSELGALYVFLSGCGALNSSYTYQTSGTPFQFTDITLSRNETEIWGANQIDNVVTGECTITHCTDAQAVGYTPSATNPLIGVILPAHTAPVRQSQRPGSGIAVWPPGPV